MTPWYLREASHAIASFHCISAVLPARDERGRRLGQVLALSPMRVLIVDDVAAVREALRLLLSEEPGVEVVGEAADGEQALRQVEALAPELVLMDLEMPRFGGLLAIRELSLLPRPPRIVAMSVYGADEAARARALAAGASVFVEKGATLTEVVAALRTALPPASD